MAPRPCRRTSGTPWSEPWHDRIDERFAARSEAGAYVVRSRVRSSFRDTRPTQANAGGGTTPRTGPAALLR
jgi:hypothetical protein